MEGFVQLRCPQCGRSLYLEKSAIQPAEADPTGPRRRRLVREYETVADPDTTSRRSASRQPRCPYCREDLEGDVSPQRPASERRRHPRLSLQGAVGFDDEGAARLGDLSEGGCAFFAGAEEASVAERLKEGQVKDFLIDVEDGPRFEVRARVRRIRTAPPPNRFKVALAFEEPISLN